jgi:hypothetical protein
MLCVADLRNELMPINKTYPLTEVLEAAEEYAEKSGRQVTYEYILLAGKNDSDADAELLADYMRFKHATVNVIPVNPVPEQGFVRPGRKKIDRFMAALEKRRVNATLRIEMGADINAACGQLRASHLQKTSGLKHYRSSFDRVAFYIYNINTVRIMLGRILTMYPSCKFTWACMFVLIIEVEINACNQ